MSLSGQDGGGVSGEGGRQKLVGRYREGVGGKRNGKRHPKSGSRASQVVTEERLAAERSALIAEKHAELECVYDRHDTLVREIFHMEHFIMMLGFNPQEAKQEDSVVFREYKAKYDLLDKAAPTAGPSRKTRSARTEHRQFIDGPSISAPPAPAHKGKSKGKAPVDTGVIWDILASAKGKGKSKEKVTHGPGTEDEDSISRSRRQHGKESIYSAFGRKEKGRRVGHGRTFSLSERGSRVTAVNPFDSEDVSATQGQTLLAQDQNDRGRLRKRTIADSMTNGHSPQKRRKTEPGPHSEDLGPMDGHVLPNSMSSVPTYTNGSSRSSRRMQDPTIHSTTLTGKTSRVMPNRAATRRASQLSAHSTIVTRAGTLQNDGNLVPFPKTNIKRVKLLVRRPPPSLSNPRQKPPPSRHNSSLPTFLLSYTTLNDQDLDDAALEQQALTDAALLERVAEFRRQGRFIPGTDVLFGTSADTEMSFTTPKRASTDAWDDVVEAVVAQGRLRSRRVTGRQIAAQIAGKMQTYWDGHAARKDKARAQEERRLKALAKASIKIVTSEWKKAVFHIREKERLKLEAEEVKRGHEHLDAILDQSGHILETQQGDLTRGDIPQSGSRSSSVSATLRNWASDVEDDEEDVENDEDIENDEDVENEEGVENEEDVENEDIGDEDVGDAEEEQDIQQVFAEHPVSEDEEDAGMDKSASGLDDDGTVYGIAPQSVTSSLLGPSDDELPLEQSPPSEFDLDHDDSSVIAVDELINVEYASSPQSPRSISPMVPEQHLKDPVMADPSYISPQPSIPDLDGRDETTAVPPMHSPEPGLVDGVDMTNGIDSAVAGHRLDQPISSPRKCDEFSTPKCDIQKQPDVNPGPELEATQSVEFPSSSNSFENGDLQLPSSPHVVTTEGPGFGSTANTVVSTTSLEEEANAIQTPASAGVVDAVVEDGVEDEDEDYLIPEYLKPYAVAPVEWHSDDKIKPPLLLRGILRPYQQSGLEWLASLHVNNLNGILADEMGLGKTIQTIALLAHLACDRGIWGPHLIVVPTSVLLNWEMEFKKFLPGFKILSYHGTTKRRKELRQGWNDKHHFNVCITSYTLASRDAHIFKRKAWYYMILDEAHMIKNFKSQRWNILLMFRSFRRLLLTGTPLQNNLTELWALLQFLMSGANFANLKEFGEWFSNPLEKAIEMGNVLDDETQQRVSKLHTVLRPYLLRRLKRDVEKELPSKYEHLVLCPLSKRQRFLYDEFMSRAHTRDALQSGIYQKIANILMQLRKVCNHPDLFEVRPIVTSFAMERSAIADFEIKELLIRRQLLDADEEKVNLEVLGFRFIDHENTSVIAALESRRLDGTSRLPCIFEIPGESPPRDTRTIVGFRKYADYQRRASSIARWAHIGYLNRLRCSMFPVYSQETITIGQRFYQPIVPLSALDTRSNYLDTVHLVNSSIKSFATRAEEMASLIDKFTFVTPAVVVRNMPHITLSGCEPSVIVQDIGFDDVLHRASVKLQIAFPDPSLLQYDCGKMQELARLLREKKAGGHRVLIFTQMTKILDILEIFLNFHGYLYLRLDGATKIEDRQYITERFNADSRVFCFIASSRSGGVGINLTGADTVVFYDSDFNPQMDRQCEDRAHRIGQIRDVHIYRFVSQHTVEEAMLRKANQKRSLDDLVIQKGEFDWRSLFGDESALTKALGEFEDTEDAHAAAVAAREEVVMEGADEADFGGDVDVDAGGTNVRDVGGAQVLVSQANGEDAEFEDEVHDEEGEDGADEEGGTIVDYMLGFVLRDYEFFRDWRL